ncbi:MAG: heme lyase CcmF/NrfE family subunit [Hyphomonadaceae bacterium]
MLIEFGHLALAAALIAALMQSSALVLPSRFGHLGRPAAATQAVALLIAFVALVAAFSVSDFSGKLVASNSHTLKPWFYKLAGAWGNHEGSMLLWALIMSVYGWLVSRDEGIDDKMRQTATSIMGALGLGVCLFLLISSNPFERLDPAPFEGRGLNPLLQDVALVIHPPVLYAGYVGFAAPYALAIAALLNKASDKKVAGMLLRWSLAPMAFLTLGVGLGSWWAYRELGWGGWWFWDPVENASLMPLLMGIASVHMALLWRRTGQFAGLTLFAMIATFCFSVLGTFIVRSGALTSVHSFAVDPLRGTLILLYMFAVIGFGAFVFFRAKPLNAPNLKRQVSRELALLIGAGLLGAATLTVCIGTLYPLLIEQLGGDPLTVGAPYFNKTASPMLGLSLILLVLATATRWGGAGGLSTFKMPLLVSAATGAIATLVIWLTGGLGAGASAIIGAALMLPAFVFYQEIWLGRLKQFGMGVAHFGFAIAAVGMIGSAALSQDIVTAVKPGDVVETPGHMLTFNAVERQPGPNYVREFSTVNIVAKASGKPLGSLAPERRWYPSGDTVTTEAAIRSTVFADLYVTLGDLRTPGATEPDWALRIRHRPFISWIWFGLLLAFFGSIQATLKRVEPRPAREPATAAAVPAE